MQRGFLMLWVTANERIDWTLESWSATSWSAVLAGGPLWSTQALHPGSIFSFHAQPLLANTHAHK